MRVSFTTYKNSSAATALSILGTCSALIGLFSMMISVMMLIQSVDEDSVGTMIVGVLFFLLGLWMTQQAQKVSKRKMINQIIQEIRTKGLEQQIQYSYEAAVQLYNLAPDKMMLEYIRSLNPQFAQSIQMASDNQKKKGI